MAPLPGLPPRFRGTPEGSRVTGYRSQFFRHECGKHGCYVEQLPSWDDLIECFPRGIRPTDVDGMVEINGNVLILEEKGEGVGPDEGQRRALKVLSDMPQVTVLYMRPRGDRMQVLVLGEGDAQGWQDVTRDDLKRWLRWWAARADRKTVAVRTPAA